MADQTTQSNIAGKDEKNDSKKQQQTGPNSQPKGKGDNIPEGNQVWVSSQKRPPFYGNIALKMLLKNETVELHGLGNAIASAVEVSQYIIPTGKATLQKITTSSVVTSANNKPEIVIILQRTSKALETTIDDNEYEEEDGYEDQD